MLAVISIPVIVKGTVQTDSSNAYELSLTATVHYADVTLTAHLTLSEEYHDGKGRAYYEEENVAGATINFYTCNSKGVIIKEIGYNVTIKDGTTTWKWSATSNGKYWFIAVYSVCTKSEEE